MTRRDYVLLSTALREAVVRADMSEGARHYRIGVALAANEIARAIAKLRPGFDTPLFLKDSGVEPIAPSAPDRVEAGT